MADSTADEIRARRQRELSNKLKAAGFDPGVPYYWIEDHDFEAIRMSTFRDALFGSSYWHPIAVPLEHHSYSGEAPTRIPVIPELVEAKYQLRHLSQDPEEKPYDCFDYPEWYVRGMVHRRGFPSLVVHLYIVLDGNQGDKIQTINFQLVAEPSGADPSTELVVGTGVPGTD